MVAVLRVSLVLLGSLVVLSHSRPAAAFDDEEIPLTPPQLECVELHCNPPYQREWAGCQFEASLQLIVQCRQAADQRLMQCVEYCRETGIPFIARALDQDFD